MRRRDFIAGLGGVAAWPRAARAQQGQRIRRIGVLMGGAENDPANQSALASLRQGLMELGWTERRNVLIDYRWGADFDLIRRYAVELAALDPDVILASAGVVVAALQQATRTVPIVFTGVIDPVGAGLVASLARPGGNATGFTAFDYGLSGKWLQLLKEIAPQVTRAVVVRTRAFSSGPAQLGALQVAAPSSGVELTPVDASDVEAIERTVTAFARGSNGGLIVTLSLLAYVHRQEIIALAARYRLPAVYPTRPFVVDGGLIRYGPVTTDVNRRAAGYLDRILRGERPADLPVQAPTKYELVINLKTAKAIVLEVPPLLLARADEVIE